jgi:hypothetical protein
MNERMKELAKQLGYNVNYKPSDDETDREYQVVSNDFAEKFTELIVRECVEQLRYTVLDTQELRRDKSTDYQVGWEDGMFDAEEMIKQHFRS